MRENKVKRALQRGETVIGTMITEVRNPAIAQILAVAGFDFMFIDMEHGSYNMETVADTIQAARLAGICPLVRVTNPEYHLMARPLDAGAQGLMIPRVETVEQVEHIVASTKYPPRGLRGCSVLRGHSDYQREKVKDFIERMDAENLVILQIEGKRAIESIDDLVSVPGVDAAVIGPNDLSISLGVPGQMDHPLLRESIDRVIDACRRRGVASGIHIGNMEALKGWMRKGMRFIAYSTEVSFILGAGKAAVDELRAEAKSL